MTHTFSDSLAFASNPVVRGELDTLYKTVLFPGAKVERIEDLAKHEQHHGDERIVLRAAQGRLKYWNVEEKIRDGNRYGPGDLVIETKSAAEFETSGWIYTTETDWLVYARANGHLQSALLLGFEELRRWFVCADPDAYPLKSADNGSYRTQFRVVPLAALRTIPQRWLLPPQQGELL